MSRPPGTCFFNLHFLPCFYLLSSWSTGMEPNTTHPHLLTFISSYPFPPLFQTVHPSLDGSPFALPVVSSPIWLFSSSVSTTMTEDRFQWCKRRKVWDRILERRPSSPKSCKSPLLLSPHICFPAVKLIDHILDRCFSFQGQNGGSRPSRDIRV